MMMVSMIFLFLLTERKYWSPHDPIFVCEALFAFANVLSFSRLSYILPINEFLGPLQISLGRMIGDIVRFGAVFTVVFLAFFCSFLNLYWFLGDESQFGTYVHSFIVHVRLAVLAQHPEYELRPLVRV